MGLIEKLQKRALKKIIESNLSKRDNSDINSPLVTLGILVEESFTQDFEALYDLASVLGLQRKDVKIFSFLELEHSVPSFQQNQINHKDFNWKGEIKSQNASEFLDVPYDVLIGYYNKKHIFLDMMVSSSRAKFKVGMKGADSRLFDLLISVNTDEKKAFKTELKKYLKILNKIE